MFSFLSVSCPWNHFIVPFAFLPSIFCGFFRFLFEFFYVHICDYKTHGLITFCVCHLPVHCIASLYGTWCYFILWYWWILWEVDCTVLVSSNQSHLTSSSCWTNLMYFFSHPITSSYYFQQELMWSQADYILLRENGSKSQLHTWDFANGQNDVKIAAQADGENKNHPGVRLCAPSLLLPRPRCNALPFWHSCLHSSAWWALPWAALGNDPSLTALLG